jgi:putative nucleotidyltransferase with HDIG domain
MSLDAKRETILKAMESFPSVSPAAGEVLSLLNNPETNVSAIESAVKYDPGLTANILKMTNSAFFGFPGSIASITQAITRLGWKRMYQIVVASSVNAMMDRHVPGYDLDRGELWRHSVAASVASEILIRQRNLNASDETFTAALLHDIGKLLLGEFVSEDLSLIDVAAAKGISFVEAEREVLGTDHAEVGAWVLEHWSLPQNLVRAVRYHHEPGLLEEPDMTTDVVHVADVLCLMMGMGVGHEGLQYELSTEVTERLNLHASHLEAVGVETVGAVDDLSKVLSSQ